MAEQHVRLKSPHSKSFSEALSVDADAHGSWIFVSGQVGVPMTGGHQGLSFEDEVRVCFERIAASLEALGATMADIVKLQAYLTSLEPYAEYSKVRSAFFQQDPPASTAVQVAGLLLGARVEIDAVAFMAKAAASP